MSAPNNPKLGNLSFSGNGDNTAIAASTGNSLHIWKLALNNAASVTITLKDGASTTLANFVMAAVGSMVLDGPEGFPLCVTSPGNAFIINLSSGVGISGAVWYTLS